MSYLNRFLKKYTLRENLYLIEQITYISNTQLKIRSFIIITSINVVEAYLPIEAMLITPITLEPESHNTSNTITSIYLCTVVSIICEQGLQCNNSLSHANNLVGLIQISRAVHSKG